MFLDRAVGAVLWRLPKGALETWVWDPDEWMPGWLYGRYRPLESRLNQLYNREVFRRSKGCPVCGAHKRLVGKRPEGGFLIRCDNGHDLPNTVQG